MGIALVQKVLAMGKKANGGGIFGGILKLP